MNYNKKDRDNYNHDRDITCDRLGITKNQYNQFRRIGQSLRKIYEMNCNGEFGNEFQYEEATNDDYHGADNLAKKLGLEIFYQTDPRGATIYLDKEPIPENNYTNACCIY